MGDDDLADGWRSRCLGFWLLASDRARLTPDSSQPSIARSLYRRTLPGQLAAARGVARLLVAVAFRECGCSLARLRSHWARPDGAAVERVLPCWLKGSTSSRPRPVL